MRDARAWPEKSFIGGPLGSAGQFAEAAKGMLATIDSTLTTKYENPAAAAAKEKKGTKKK